MPKLANVALPVAVDSTFTYLVPPELEHSVQIGVRVIVPFGRKYATGLIVDLPDSTTLTSLKPLRDILDGAPVVAGELLGLCRWIADYYFAPLGEVIKAALPHGFASSNKRSVSLVEGIPEALLLQAKHVSRQRTTLLDWLMENGPALSSELQKKTGLKNINAVLNELQQQGIVHVEEILPQLKTGLPKKDVVLFDKLDPTELIAALNALSPRKKKAASLLKSVGELKEAGVKEMFLSDVMKKAGVSLATVREFVNSGLLTVEKREIPTQQQFGTEEQTLGIALNTAQQSVLQSITRNIDAGENRTLLLHGVTGSGKTQVYIEAIRHCLTKGRSAVILVPEISLTPQIARRFKSHFREQVAVVHSNMSANERNEVWLRARRGEYRVVIGPRSAVFAPLGNIGLIVVDEEHEPSYKQFEATPRYNARDVAIVRGKLNNAVVLLGSATPSAESYYNVTTGKYQLLEMPLRVHEGAMPAVTIVNMTDERKREYFAMKASAAEEHRVKLREFQQSSFSQLLRQKIRERLDRNEAIILLQNRRGFSPFVECMDCGNTIMCPHCNVTLTYHITRRHLRCHYCGRTQKPPEVCPNCTSTAMQQRGAGTQRVEQELAMHFPKARVLRMDMDTTTRKGSHQRLLESFGEGKADILLGTQMVAKGLDFARVTLVGVISADTQLLLPDFRASERTFQLLTQVAGRAGRSTLSGEVIIQTHQPLHYTLQHVVDHNFTHFVEVELAERKELAYPPFSRLALVEFKGPQEEHVQAEAQRFAGLLQRVPSPLTILGPSPAVISKIKKLYRWHIIIKSLKSTDPAGSQMRNALRSAFREFSRARSSVKLIVDIDPAGLM